MEDSIVNRNENLSLSRLMIENFLSRKNELEKHYKVACAWSGALALTGKLEWKTFQNDLIECYSPFKNSYKELLKSKGHVDHNVFGIVPLEIYLQNKDQEYLEEGLLLADHQRARLQDQIRYAIDDMFMIPRLQLQAFRASGKMDYLDTAASVLSLYIDRLQQADGLFFHHPDFQYKWGRGNGWVAAGLASILSVLPRDHRAYESIKKGYIAMMKGLKETQIKEETGLGLWKQILNSEDKRNWPESSGSAMFSYALRCGIRQGILDPLQYKPVWENAWKGLKERIDVEGNLMGISKWAYKPESHKESVHLYDLDEENYYFDREQLCGDLHGQAPVMWVMGEMDVVYDISGKQGG